MAESEPEDFKPNFLASALKFSKTGKEFVDIQEIVIEEEDDKDSLKQADNLNPSAIGAMSVPSERLGLEAKPNTI